MRGRCWHLCSNRWNSAITEYAISAARALQDLGHGSLFFPLASAPAAARVREHMTIVPMLNFSLAALPRLLAKARLEQPDLIFCYGGPETVLALALKRVFDVKVVRFRGHEVRDFGAWSRLRHWGTHGGIDLLITPSVTLEAAVRRLRLPVPVVTVALGCDPQSYHRVAPTPEIIGILEVTEAEPRPEMLVFGRFDPVKGHAEMIARTAAILKLWGNRPRPPRLHIVGDPANSTVAELEDAVKRAHLKWQDDVLITTGRVENVAELLSRAALGVIPSLGSEIICRVAEEFLLCGTPIAVSGVGSLDDVLFPGAGFSYANLGAMAANQQFVDWLGISLAEGEFAKAARAQAALARFSLATMGAQLERTLSEHGLLA